MNNDISKIEEAKNTLIGRVFTLGGSVVFLIGSFIAVVLAFQAYNKLIHN
ncbi:hypothetical protein ACFQ9Y_25815 [Peribacillus simplex]